MRLDFLVALVVAFFVGLILTSAFERTRADLDRCHRAVALAKTSRDSLDLMTRDAFCGRVLVRDRR